MDVRELFLYQMQHYSEKLSKNIAKVQRNIKNQELRLKWLQFQQEKLYAYDNRMEQFSDNKHQLNRRDVNIEREIEEMKNLFKVFKSCHYCKNSNSKLQKILSKEHFKNHLSYTKDDNVAHCNTNLLSKCQQRCRPLDYLNIAKNLKENIQDCQIDIKMQIIELKILLSEQQKLLSTLSIEDL